MKIFKVSKGIYDIFLDFDTLPTGFEPSCWLRIQTNLNTEKSRQLAGIKLPGYKFIQVIKNLETYLRMKEL